MTKSLVTAAFYWTTKVIRKQLGIKQMLAHNIILGTGGLIFLIRTLRLLLLTQTIFSNFCLSYTQKVAIWHSLLILYRSILTGIKNLNFANISTR